MKYFVCTLDQHIAKRLPGGGAAINTIAVPLGPAKGSAMLVVFLDV